MKWRVVPMSHHRWVIIDPDGQILTAMIGTPASCIALIRSLLVKADKIDKQA